MVDWEFFLDLLAAWEFGHRWVRWISNIFQSSKANILIDGSPNGHVRYQKGLCQGDTLSPLLFVLAMDVLSSMFSHALTSRVLFGVPLGDFKTVCHLQYADDLIILSAGGWEDLKLIKLLFFHFEGISGLFINLHKTCLIPTNSNSPPNEDDLSTLRCTSSTLPINYLGIPLARRRPRKQEWEKLISLIRTKLDFWKANFLSLSDWLILINTVLFAIPTYWIPIFKLSSWGIRSIDWIRSYFLWTGPDINKPKCCLVN